MSPARSRALALLIPLSSVLAVAMVVTAVVGAWRSAERGLLPVLHREVAR